MRFSKLKCLFLCCIALGVLLAAPAYADFAQSDLEGNWNGYALYTSGWQGWERFDTTLDASGSGNYQAVLPNGGEDQGEITGLDLSKDGIITTEQRASLHGILSQDKNIFAYTGTYSIDGTPAYALNIHVKTGGSFSQSDLEGTWYGHSLTSGSLEGWEHSTLEINENGDATYSAVNSGGGEYEDTANLQIKEDGSITRTNSDSFHGTMTLDKNIFVATETAGENEYMLHIFVKGGGDFDNFDWAGSRWRGRSLYTGDWQAWDSEKYVCSDREGNGFGAYHYTYPVPADSYEFEAGEFSNKGILTSPSSPGHGVLSIDRNIMIYTDTYPLEGDETKECYRLTFYALSDSSEQQADSDSEQEALTTTSLSGNYDWIWFGPGESTMEVNTAGMTLGEDGTWDMELPDGAYSGTYAINDQGRLTIEITAPESEAEKITENGAVSPDGDLIVIPEATQEPGMVFLMKQEPNPAAVDLINQRYNFVDFSDATQSSLEMGAGYIVFGKTYFTYHEEYNASEGDAADYTENRIEYSVNAEGNIEVPDKNGTGYISPDGNFIVFTNPEKDEILFLSRAGIVDEGEMFGRYQLAGMDYDFGASDPGPQIESGSLMFDGNGQWEYGAENENGTYAAETFGRLLIDDNNTTYGALSPNGDIAIKPDTDDGEIGISFLVKAPKTDECSSATNVKTSSDNVTINKEKTKTTALATEEIRDTYGVSDFKPAAEACSITASVTGDELKAAFSYDVADLSGTASDYQLVKLKSSDADSLKFSYAAQGAQANGEWWFTDADGNYVNPAASLDNTKTYTVNFVVEDDSKFDLNTTAGTIKDPTVLGTSAETTSEDDSSDDDSSCFIRNLIR